MKMKKYIALTALASTLFMGNPSVNAQSIPFPQPSPTTTISQNFATSKIEISYSRPSAKGRKIFGDVVPYGKFWRTGANAATTVSFGEDVKINGTDIKAGKYGLISFPGESEWIIVLSKDLTVNSADAYKQENDVARFTVKVEANKNYVETFTIEVGNMRNDACDLILKWEQVTVRLKVMSFYDERLTKQITDVMAKDSRPYYGAANYYYENGKDLNQALTWVNKALEANPTAYWVWLLKAKIQKGLKDYNGALESSTKSYDLAKADNDEAYMRNNEKLMAEIKATPGFVPAKPKKK
jgi:tetratricopeptide (TPR) repeat protein